MTLRRRILALALAAVALLLAGCGSGSDDDVAAAQEEPATSAPDTTASTTTTAAPTSETDGLPPMLEPQLSGDPMPEGRWLIEIGQAQVTFETAPEMSYRRLSSESLTVGLVDVDTTVDEIVVARITAAWGVNAATNNGPLPRDFGEWVEEHAVVTLIDQGEVPGTDAVWYDVDVGTDPNGNESCYLGPRCLTWMRTPGPRIEFIRHVQDSKVRFVDLRPNGVAVFLVVNATPEHFDALAELALEFAPSVELA